MATENTSPMYQDVLDIIFAGRNKAYGAYMLRKSYPNYVRNAMGVTFLALLLLVAIPLIKKFAGINSEKEKFEKVIVELAPPPPMDKNTPPPPPPPPVKTPPPTRPQVKFIPPVIKKDEEVKEEVPPPKEEDLKDKDAGTKDIEGDKNAKQVVEDPGLGPEPEKPAVIEAPKKEEIFTVVEQMPSFEGGDAELLKYLAKNIRYPDIARESGIEGTVVIEFVVSEDGSISDTNILKEIGGGCGKEAIRVVSSMPKWKPGKQNGRPVKVRFKLPVKFRLG